MIALDKAILLGVMRVAQQHADSQTLAEAQQGGGKVATARTAHEAHIAIQAHHLGEPLTHKQLRHRFHGGLGMKVSAHLRIHQHRGALINDVEHFDHMLLLAVDLGRHGGRVLKIELPLTHGRGALQRLLDVRLPLGDASG
jgi:hypothetical protein